MMKHLRSLEAYKAACKVLPGGVDSPVRSFSAIHGTPIFVAQAKGAGIQDIDGNTYIDYIGSWGPMILGHQFDPIFEGIEEEIRKGISYGLPCEKEAKLAELIIDAYPGIEMIRFVTSGTEATMSAIRAARGFTGRDKIVKFAGCYHGHHDSMLVSSGSGALTLSTPDSKGVPASMAMDTLLADYNDIASVKRLLKAYPDQIAAIIIEPIAGNMGVVPAQLDFLKALRRCCDEHSILLIFDEVISGFRVAYGGAASVYGITPDLACFGKIIGAGMSVGAYGGRKDIMNLISPSGGVYQAGTLAGNPLAMHLGIQQLSYLRAHKEVYTHLEEMGERMEKGIQNILREAELPYQVQRAGSLLTIFFTAQKIHSFSDVLTCDREAFSRYYRLLLEEGILCAPSQFEAIFISAAHQKDDIDKTLRAMKKALIGSIV